jgi:pimeloyl-ACP methyl ester carboxylesterase
VTAGAPGFGWEAGHLDAGGWRTALYRGGAGAPVLLVHGASVAVDARLTWFRVAPRLAAGHSVIAYDQPGFGRSAMPAAGAYPDRLERAEHAAALVERLDLRDLTVIGHSEGGFVAAMLALRQPARVARAVIVASGGAAPRLGGERDAAWQAAARAAYDYPARTVDEDTFACTEGFLRERADPEFEALLRANFRAARASGNLSMFLAKAGRSRGYEDYTALQERALLPRLHALRAPVLLVWGGRDATVPVARGRALARMIPGAAFHVFEASGHWVPVEEGEGFARLVGDWLSG